MTGYGVSSRRLRCCRCDVFGGGGNECSAHRLYLSNSVGHRYQSHVTKTSKPSSAISIFGLIFEYIIYTICTRIRKDSSLARVELLWSSRPREKANKTPRGWKEGQAKRHERSQHNIARAFVCDISTAFLFARRAYLIRAYLASSSAGRACVCFFGSRD